MAEKTVEKNLFELLLEEDNLIEKTKDLEITRLSEKFGKKFIITIKSLTEEEITNCTEGNDERLEFILESVTIEGKSLKDKSLLDKFKVKIARDVVGKILNVGEIRWLYAQILVFNGLSRNSIVELKN